MKTMERDRDLPVSSESVVQVGSLFEEFLVDDDTEPLSLLVAEAGRASPPVD